MEKHRIIRYALILFLCLWVGMAAAAPPSSTYTYTEGSTIEPSEVQTNENNIYRYLSTGVDTYVDGSITYGKLAGSIPDSKLNQITTSEKVSGTSLTGLASVSSGAGIIPTVNLEAKAWTDYSTTSTVVGWSGSPTKTIFYKKTGKAVFVSFNFTGTSDSTAISFTLPYASAAGVTFGAKCSFAIDNTSTEMPYARAALEPSASTCNIYTDFVGTSWTASGTKAVNGEFWYEASS